MRHPGDLSALQALLEAGAVRPQEIVAVIGKTEGNGGVNDFTRGYFTQALMGLLARTTATAAEDDHGLNEHAPVDRLGAYHTRGPNSACQ